jgi:hypothetical protein
MTSSTVVLLALGLTGLRPPESDFKGTDSNLGSTTAFKGGGEEFGVTSTGGVGAFCGLGFSIAAFAAATGGAASFSGGTDSGGSRESCAGDENK